jgi:hypothetical protein
VAEHRAQCASSTATSTNMAVRSISSTHGSRSQPIHTNGANKKETVFHTTRPGRKMASSCSRTSHKHVVPHAAHTRGTLPRRGRRSIARNDSSARTWEKEPLGRVRAIRFGPSACGSAGTRMHVSDAAIRNEPSPLDLQAIVTLAKRAGVRGIQLVRLVSRFLLYSVGFLQRPRLREVGAKSSPTVATLLRGCWVAVAALKNIIGLDRWLSQLIAIAVFQFALWALRQLFEAQPSLALWKRTLLSPSWLGLDSMSSWDDSETRAASLRMALAQCKSFAEHRQIAAALDRATGAISWRVDDEASPKGLLDSKELRRRIANYRTLEARKDVRALMWCLRAELHRRPAGSGSPQLYGVTASGTKVVVEEHVQAAASALDFVCDSCSDEEIPSRLAFFQEARHAFGRAALLLSGGATNGVYHLGVIKALKDVHLLPPIISGASAGSIVAALLGCKVSGSVKRRLVVHECVCRRMSSWSPF